MDNANETKAKSPTLQQIEELAKRAGTILLSYFTKQLTITQKSHNQGIVTDADVASEEAIVSFINKHFVGHAILAEESGVRGLDRRGDEAVPLWVIDPLDGTTNYSKRNPYHCVSIGFGYSQRGKYTAELGVVYQPCTGDLYSAQVGKGAFHNGKRLTISREGDPKNCCVATGFASNRGEKLSAILKSIHAFQSDFLGVRINGAAALDLCHTASGRIQAFYEAPLFPWDFAAGSLIVSEAGGVVTNYDGEPFDALAHDNLIASSREIFPHVLAVVQKTIARGI